MMTQSTCYKGTRKFTPKGVLWHSTGANNPNLKRYVQPDDHASDKAEWLARLGKNQYANDWNHKEVQAGLNFWIGKLADGTVAAVQTMPWDYRPWGCGSGSKGSCNDTHIQFEICEDGLTDKSYWNAVYREACEMTAYLCKMNGIEGRPTIFDRPESEKKENEKPKYKEPIETILETAHWILSKKDEEYFVVYVNTFKRKYDCTPEEFIEENEAKKT